MEVATPSGECLPQPWDALTIRAPTRKGLQPQCELCYIPTRAGIAGARPSATLGASAVKTTAVLPSCTHTFAVQALQVTATYTRKTHIDCKHSLCAGKEHESALLAHTSLTRLIPKSDQREGTLSSLQARVLHYCFATCHRKQLFLLYTTR